MAVEDHHSVRLVSAMKGKPKKKAKGKAKAKARRLHQEDGAPPKPREPRINKDDIKAKLTKELESREAAEVLQEARERLALAEQVIKSLDAQDASMHDEGARLKSAVETASQKVNNCFENEVEAIEKLKAATAKKEEAMKSSNSIKGEKTENDKFMAMMAAEYKNRSNSIEAGKAKRSAKEAAATAKQALAEHRILEREAQANQKQVMQEQRERERAIMLKAGGASPGAKARLKASAQEAKKAISHELADFDKIRAARMKMRAQLSKGKVGGKGGKAPGTPKRKIADVD